MELPDIRRAIHHLVKDSNPDVRHFVSFLPPILRNDLCQEEKVRALLSWPGWSGLRRAVLCLSCLVVWVVMPWRIRWWLLQLVSTVSHGIPFRR